jgi:hypothetical protein
MSSSNPFKFTFTPFGQPAVSVGADSHGKPVPIPGVYRKAVAAKAPARNPAFVALVSQPQDDEGDEFAMSPASSTGSGSPDSGSTDDGDDSDVDLPPDHYGPMGFVVSDSSETSSSEESDS